LVLLEVNGKEYVLVTNSQGVAVEDFIKRMNTEKTGLKNVREAIKVGNGDNKRTHRIRRIVYVMPKKEAAVCGERDVDWSHRWFVRGHWRTVNGVGKDRAGDYCVSGYTWVSEYLKGPEGLPVVANKTRVVIPPGQNIILDNKDNVL
jgi:hypothetical protein